MPSYREDYPEKWLKAAHLQGRAVTITISHVSKEEIFDRQTNQKVKRYAAHFPGKDKMLLLNKTGLESLEAIAGTDQWDQWQNLRVVLAPKSTRLGDTITISRAQQAQAQVDGARQAQPGARPAASAPQQAQVHGQAEPAGAWPEDRAVITDLDTPLDSGFGPDMENQVHGQVHGQHGLEEDEDFGSLHGQQEEGEVHGEHYDKSADPDSRYSVEVVQDGLFFGVTDLLQKVRSLHQESEQPMDIKQHGFIVNKLSSFSKKDGLTILSLLLGRTVSEANPAGDRVGRYLWELLRPEQPLLNETDALAAYCKDYVKK